MSATTQPGRAKEEYAEILRECLDSEAYTLQGVALQLRAIGHESGGINGLGGYLKGLASKLETDAQKLLDASAGYHDTLTKEAKPAEMVEQVDEDHVNEVLNARRAG